MTHRLLITCEHGGCDVPSQYAALFAGHEEVLRSHRGWDPGSLEMGQAFVERFGCPFIAATVTRLLVELNRSPRHRRLFSEFTASLNSAERTSLLEGFYLPYRSRVASEIAESVGRGDRAVHLSMHSFTPELNGQVRNADVGLLYDPARPLERQFCVAWQQSLLKLRPDLRVRRNYPYLGTSDGFTTYLRRMFPAESYLGIELEVNQRWPLGDPEAWQQLQRDIVESFATVLSHE